MTFVSNSEKETIEIGKKIASTLNPRSIVVLTGNLGAGKTKLVEGMLNFFGIANSISSPTFSIVNEYNLSSTNIYHFDVYRLENIDEFYDIGGDEYFENGICLIEWGEQIEKIIPLPYITITFTGDNNNESKRIITIKTKEKLSWRY